MNTLDHHLAARYTRAVGVFSGSISYCRFFVRGEVPPRFEERFFKNIKLRVMDPLTAESEEEERVGWCAPGNALDLDLTAQKLLIDNYLTLGLRTDKWSIPRGLFNAHFDVARAEHIARTGREKLTKREKEDLKFRINKKLKRKLIPTTRHTDVCWMLKEGVVLLWSRSARTKEDFMTLFEQTFALSLEEASPYVVARRLLGPEEEAKLTAVDQTSLGRGAEVSGE